MLQSLRSVAERFYERVLISELSETPSHVAVIQDGNRRYARQKGKEKTEGYQAGADTTESLLHWCDELGIEEVTLYAFSTENFNRSEEEREHLFDLISDKLREFADADRVHESDVRIRAIGDTKRLPDRVLDAISYAEERTDSYDSLYLNVALAYGGRAELLDAARSIASDIAAGQLDPADVDVEAVETALYDGPTQDVDLIVRTGGDERTSNFLPWQANGNEAAVYFSAPYWPEFRKIDFLRSIRTYEHREASWRQTRAERAKAVIRTLGPGRSTTARSTLERLREQPEYADDAAEDATPGGNIDPAD